MKVLNISGYVADGPIVEEINIQTPPSPPTSPVSTNIPNLELNNSEKKDNDIIVIPTTN